MVKPKKSWGDSYFADTPAADPTEDIRQHFTGVFANDAQAGLDQDLASRVDALAQSGGVPITEREVRAAVMSGRRGKSVGPDMVPVEFLVTLLDVPQGLQKLTAFFLGVYLSASIPDDWGKSVLSLLPKQHCPVVPSQLRPIALSSHIGKTFARILLARTGRCLEAAGPSQLASKGRQGCDMVWVARHVCSLCREWGKQAVIVKLDLRRAFDSVDRRALASKLEEWMGSAFPQEAACFIAMLATNHLQVILPWSDQVDISSGVGVKQGSTESPSLFSRLMDDILVEVRGLQGDTLFDDLGDSTAAFMDDVLGWFPDAAALNIFFRALLPRLGAFGLTLQPTKCQMMLLGGIADPELVLDGVPLVPLPRDEPLYVMHLPVHPAISDMDLAVFLLDKARSKFYSLLPVLSSKASLPWRLQLLDKTVLGAIKWVLGILCPAPKIQQCINHFQFRCVRTMMGLRRRPQRPG